MAVVLKWFKDRQKTSKGQSSTSEVSGCVRHNQRPLPEIPQSREPNCRRNPEHKTDLLFFNKKDYSPYHVYEEIPYDLVTDLNKLNDFKNVKNVRNPRHVDSSRKANTCVNPYLVTPIHSQKYHGKQPRDSSDEKYGFPQDAKRNTQPKNRSWSYLRDNVVSQKSLCHKSHISSSTSLKNALSHDTKVAYPFEKRGSHSSINQENYHSFGSATSKSDSDYTYNEYDVQISPAPSTGSHDHVNPVSRHRKRSDVSFYDSDTDSLSRESDDCELEHYMEKVKQNLKFEAEVLRIARQSEISKFESETSQGNDYIHLSSLESKRRCSLSTNSTCFAELEKKNGVIQCNRNVPNSLFYRSHSDTDIDIAAIEKSALSQENNSSTDCSSFKGFKIPKQEYNKGNNHVLARDTELKTVEKAKTTNQLVRGQSSSNFNKEPLKDQRKCSTDKNLEANYRKCLSYEGYSANRTTICPLPLKRPSKKVSFEEKIAGLVGKSYQQKPLEMQSKGVSATTTSSSPLSSTGNSFTPITGSSIAPTSGSSPVSITGSSPVSIAKDAGSTNQRSFTPVSTSSSGDVSSNHQNERLSIRVSKITLADVQNLRNNYHNKPTENQENCLGSVKDRGQCKKMFVQNSSRSRGGALQDLMKRNYDKQLLMLL